MVCDIFTTFGSLTEEVILSTRYDFPSPTKVQMAAWRRFLLYFCCGTIEIYRPQLKSCFFLTYCPCPICRNYGEVANGNLDNHCMLLHFARPLILAYSRRGSISDLLDRFH